MGLTFNPIFDIIYKNSKGHTVENYKLVFTKDEQVFIIKEEESTTTVLACSFDNKSVTQTGSKLEVDYFTRENLDIISEIESNGGVEYFVFKSKNKDTFYIANNGIIRQTGLNAVEAVRYLSMISTSFMMRR